MYLSHTKLMRLRPEIARRPQAIVLATMAWLLAFIPVAPAGTNGIVRVHAAGFTLGPNAAVAGGTNRLEFALVNAQIRPFTQSAVKQDSGPALFGPNPGKPYFTVRFALPIPPENATNEIAALAGL